jgi:hypothetical protein
VCSSDLLGRARTLDLSNQLDALCGGQVLVNIQRRSHPGYFVNQVRLRNVTLTAFRRLDSLLKKPFEH